MMLIDKGYYDYDFDRVKVEVKQVLYEDTVKSDSDVRSMLARFGIGTSKKETLEELQELAMKEIEQKA